MPLMVADVRRGRGQREQSVKMTEKLSLRTGSQFADLIEVVKPELIVEVGSWHGASIIRFLQESDRLSLGTRAICIDRWLGSPEHWMDENPNGEWAFSQMAVSGGEPQFIESFRSNVKDFGFEDRIEIFRATSESGLPYLAKLGLKADLVYIDGDHSRAAVNRDIQLSRLLSQAGHETIISGDDWTWVGVRRAVISNALTLRLSIFTKAKMWVVLPRTSVLVSEFSSKGWRRIPSLAYEKYLLDYSRHAKHLRKTWRRIVRKAIDPLYRLGKSSRSAGKN